MSRFLVLTLLCLSLVGCSSVTKVVVVTSTPTFAETPSPTVTPIPTETPDILAMVEAALEATRAALPTDTSLPPTYTPLPTYTPYPTYTPNATDTPKPTAKPKPRATSTPAAELLVSYQDLHYECQNNRVWHYGILDVQGYRSFQVLQVITNLTTDKTLDYWRPAYWELTDGTSVWTEGKVWQWVVDEKPYSRPPIGPGATARWTWLCYPIPQGAWVNAVIFQAWNQTYRFDFPKPGYGEFNYFEPCQ